MSKAVKTYNFKVSDLNDDLVEEFKETALAMGQSIQDAVKIAITDYVEKRK